MSYVDLATIALHRRNEMEARINVFLAKSDIAISDIMKLKTQAQNMVHRLNCQPSELKETFLDCMKQLDEYIYMITDFNIAVSKLEEIQNLETPVHDTTRIMTPQPIHGRSTSILTAQVAQTFNIIDTLSETAPTLSKTCANNCAGQKLKKAKVPRDEQKLIQFSSSSTSAESVPGPKTTNDKLDKETQCQLAENMSKMAVSDAPAPEESPREDLNNLPAQSVLQPDHKCSAIIMNIDGDSFWVITEEVDQVYDLMQAMTSYYKLNSVKMTFEDVTALTYCAFYDVSSDTYYRGLFIRLLEDDVKTAQVFLVDTGDMNSGDARRCVQPLAPAFCRLPPFARCCHLAGIELVHFHNKTQMEKQDEFLKQYIGAQCTIEVDDNTSESLGVYVTLRDGECLNQLLVAKGYAFETIPAVEKPKTLLSKTSVHSAPDPVPSTSGKRSTQSGPPEITDQLDMTDCPEYDDPVEAVMGHKCRDEIDICKHYKGPPEKTCFKGVKCKKRHVLKHPEGWTLDRVPLPRCRAAPLPAPGTWLRAHVACVAHYDRIYVHVKHDRPEEPAPSFGVVLPPSTLEALVAEMNSPAVRVAYKPLTMAPATDEMVAALYPLDNMWYRARVIQGSVNTEQSLQVMYVDYGNELWVKEDQVRILEPRLCALPAQAVPCSLAGVALSSRDAHRWAEAKRQLARIIQDKTFDARVIARGYDEITVELLDEHGYSVADKLASMNLIELKPYDVIDDTNTPRKVVVP